MYHRGIRYPSISALRSMRLATLTALLAVLPLAIAQKEWDIRGKIAAVTKAEQTTPRSAVQGSLLVRAEKGDDAAVTVTDSTKIYLEQAKDRRPVPFDALRPGLKVQVRFAGPAAQSYPIRATAAEIVILAE